MEREKQQKKDYLKSSEKISQPKNLERYSKSRVKCRSDPLSSSSGRAAVSGEASKVSSKSHFQGRPKEFSNIVRSKPKKLTTDASVVHAARKPTLPLGRIRGQPFFSNQKENRKNNDASVGKTLLIKRISSGNKGKFLYQGFEELQTKVKNSKIDVDSAEKYTPMVKFGGHKTGIQLPVSENSNGNTSRDFVRTPPLEASISPEIQCQLNSKTVSNSAAPPVCYGAGHLLSGVTDKRKCRRRGSLRGGTVNPNIFNDGTNLINESEQTSVPLLGEASVRWLSSPCKETPPPLQINPTTCGSDSSVLSVGSLGSGNIIPTPEFDSGNYGHKLHHNNLIPSEIDSLSKLSTWEDPGLDFHSGCADSTSNSYRRNVGTLSSWESDAHTVEISWKDVICRTDETDESDRWCLDADRLDVGISPVILDYEPVVSSKMNGKSTNASAESFCTNGGSLFGSEDSDWPHCHENHLL